ncbi:MaoC family dehydratase [Lutimaribacter sp. EGI FJ00015]|uniref:MaoC family dehydratase n=1 Tax=Lutimaribacter degradans TaxID=2945989 RepID=A0ACC5ZUU9_9RHOB|nr:MaoC family dehydratase [Lutimaribacter sp. EGI FJ00013]MCM2561324.1 MaoC family dehydratase [Lutimaribacter sp. EGI FJ00013]MCO0611725.1 MaoC family dehydratase [Lutimaribacter sp. EGI FJ00015]MCO0635153.1 MaoC family dehydratase [Lutimaribacter sp. EGI FJ00014]
MTFDPTSHAMFAPRRFADFCVGEVFRAPSRTMTEGVFTAFQAASGDNHPIHYDRAYLKRLGHADLMAHGYQTLIQAAIGASPLAHEMGEALIGFIAQSSRFLAPVYCGDTLYPTFEITDLFAQATTGVMTLKVTIHNQDGVQVVEGEQQYLMRL